jgi:exopolysaccharide production protein ExoQ
MSNRKQQPVPLSERVFAICALLYGSTAFIRLLVSADEYGAVGEENLASPTKRIIWLVIYVIAGYFLIRRRKLALDVLRQTPLLILLIAYIATTILWSGDRAISILSVAALTGNSLIGLYLGVRYGVPEFLRLLGWVYGIVALATLVSPVLTNDYYLDGGYWIGFFAQKNTLGMSMTIGFLVFVTLAQTSREWKWLCVGFAALCTVLVFLSRSATSIVVLFILLCVMFCHVFAEKYMRSKSSRALFASVIVVCSTMFVYWHWAGILSSLGKSEDLTGRVGIWGVLILMARDRPFLGYGYGAFWVYGGPAQTVWDTLGVIPEEASYAHNGYLQLLMDGGIAGVALLVGFLVTAFRSAWRYSRAGLGDWPMYFILFLVLQNLTEATFVVRNNVGWLLNVAVMIQVVRALPVRNSKAVRLVAVRSRQANISSAQA